MAAGHGVGDDCFLASALIRRHQPVQPGEQHRPAQEVQGADFIREGDLVGHDGRAEREVEDQVVSAAVRSCGTVDGPDLVLCAALRGWERADNVWLERPCQLLEARPQLLHA